MSENQPLVIHGWNIFAHSLGLNQFEELRTQVEHLRQKYPQDYKKKNATKRLAAIAKLAFDVIPQDPTRSDYRQGTTLGDEYKHWFRAKFFQQYRLFFRYHQESKIIVFAWVNDENSKRAYFKKMLESGNPPDNWNDLLKDAQGETNRLEKAVNVEI
ncbi:type II toxin-antitoxin system YhaV family toxin [Iningainema tapete]|uniref:Type II toxin-antitoxin system YhaV family toxin n=1 Tax=Iningainema tapete BLCC-T55 TaxID=2748662 RepID=A0A8J6XZL6_9CYAN|nr:type II toxin-antitoxin system YhaV family toxin [Iningainema tapete BLCC-T55]